jgi:S-adenosylmethionine-diacylglycerol 3-amino-3-carboxypropyl transferase
LATRNLRWDRLRYSNGWEEFDVLAAGLTEGRGTGGTAGLTGCRLLSIAAAGDNTLASLSLDPTEVVALDASRPQLACLAFKVAAFARLEHAEMLELLGVVPSTRRLELFRAIREAIPEPCADYWDVRLPEVCRGIIHLGRFERYLRGFRRFVLPLVHSEATVRALTEQRAPEGQHTFYQARWDTWRWRLIFRLFFSQRVMAALGREKAFFREVHGGVGERMLSRTARALSSGTAWRNPYLAYIISGTFPPNALPAVYRADLFDSIRARLGRIRLVHSDLSAWLREHGEKPGFDGFNLSDIFEYLPEDRFEGVYGELLKQARPGARLVYWNMLVDRRLPAVHRPRAFCNSALAERLTEQDPCWFYQRVCVDERRDEAE